MLCKFESLKLFRASPALISCRTLRKEPCGFGFGTPEREAMEGAFKRITNVDPQPEVPIIIGSEPMCSGDEQKQIMPHNHQRSVTKFFFANRKHIELGIKEAMKNQKDWSHVAAPQRAEIWRKCADIIENDERFILNAAIVMGQAKTPVQADEDTLHLVDTLRRNANYLEELAKIKICSETPDRVFSSRHLRPLDGIVAAISPFNMTSLSANLAFAPALMGNCVVWKPSAHTILSSFVVYQAMLKAGLPSGVINFIPANSKLFLSCVSECQYLTGINFIGNHKNLRHIKQEVAVNLGRYKSFPRVVGECGGKNFHFVHESANLNTVLECTMSAAFDYTGQLCQSCSRLYVPKSSWSDLKCGLIQSLNNMKIGDPCDFRSSTSALINEKNFDRFVDYLNHAKTSKTTEVVYGGGNCKTLGYYVEPTIVVCQDPLDRLMTDEIVGPMLAVYIYEDNAIEDVLKIIGKSSYFALAGSIFSTQDATIFQCLKALRMTAANMYINEKCTGSRFGHEPFGGSRLSGTNDNAGCAHCMMRWCSPQLVEESFPVNSNDCAQRV